MVSGCHQEKASGTTGSTLTQQQFPFSASYRNHVCFLSSFSNGSYMSEEDEQTCSYQDRILGSKFLFLRTGFRERLLSPVDSEVFLEVCSAPHPAWWGVRAWIPNQRGGSPGCSETPKCWNHSSSSRIQQVLFWTFYMGCYCFSRFWNQFAFQSCVPCSWQDSVLSMEASISNLQISILWSDAMS